MTISEIKEIIEAGEYTYYGIRSDVRDFEAGDMPGNSHQIYQDPEYDCDGELVYPEGEGHYAGFYDAGELPGTCAIIVDEDTDMEDAIDNIEDGYGYYGGNIYLIAGENYCEGIDEGEAIIEEAVVVAKIK